jgi:uncharacterized protein (TIGR02466 family)
MTVTSLFPIPLYYSNIGVVNDMTKQWIYKLDYPHEAAGHDHTGNKKILDEAPLKNLKEKIIVSCNKFINDELKVADVTFELQNSWINRHDKGEYNTTHWHSNSMLSGVYYIQNAPGAGDIVFQKSHLYYNLFYDTVRVNYKEANAYNTNEFYITPTEGDIVIFPSHLEHMVTPNETDIPRYSLAFNLFARGTVGEGTSELTV